MKFNFKKNKKIIISISLSTIGMISCISVFTSSSIFPNFQYKIPNIVKTIEKTNANIKSYNNYAAVDKEAKLLEIEKNLDKVKGIAANVSPSIDNLCIPKGVDYGSMMIFLEEKAAQHYLQVLDINFEGLNDSKAQENPTPINGSNPDTENPTEKSTDNTQNNTPNTTPEVPTEIPATENIQQYIPEKVTVKLMGPYKYIQEYLENIPKELGDFNYIDNIKLWKSQDTLAKQGSLSNNTNLTDDEKSILAEFDIVMYSK